MLYHCHFLTHLPVFREKWMHFSELQKRKVIDSYNYLWVFHPNMPNFNHHVQITIVKIHFEIDLIIAIATRRTSDLMFSLNNFRLFRPTVLIEKIRSLRISQHSLWTIVSSSQFETLSRWSEKRHWEWVIERIDRSPLYLLAILPVISLPSFLIGNLLYILAHVFSRLFLIIFTLHFPVA